MQGCRPLSPQEARALAGSFYGRYALRNRALVVLGIQTGYRISELLSLRVRDVQVDGQVTRSVSVQRRSMKKQLAGRRVPLQAGTRAALGSWIRALYQLGYVAPDSYLFQSASGGNRPISRSQAWRIIKGAVRRLGIPDPVATHSLRKTFANRVYEHFLERQAQGHPVDAFRLTSKALGHRAITSTDKYLSFREADLDQAIEHIWGETGTP